jgi:hypothetical protein
VLASPDRAAGVHAGGGLGERSEPAPAKAGVENQVGNARERFFTPRLHFASFAELNSWLADQCVAHAKASAHPELKEQTIWEVFEAERTMLIRYRGRFDGFHEVEASVSKSCLVRFDRNRYSVAARATHQAVRVHAYADRLIIRLNGEIVGEHARRFARDQTMYDPWHSLPVLARKPGALRNGQPFRDWALPPGLAQIRRRLVAHDDGDKQFVGILTAVLDDGLEAVEAACLEALEATLCSRDIVINILCRRRQPPVPEPIATPADLVLTIEPTADCARYDGLRIFPQAGGWRGAA